MNNALEHQLESRRRERRQKDNIFNREEEDSPDFRR